MKILLCYFLSEVIFVLFLVLGVVIYANEHETNEKTTKVPVDDINANVLILIIRQGGQKGLK